MHLAWVWRAAEEIKAGASIKQAKKKKKRKKVGKLANELEEGVGSILFRR